MKKTYQTPQIALLECWGEPLMAASGVASTDMGIDYGGVDENGAYDPESRRYSTVWGDEGE